MIAGASLVLLGISVNALFLQSARHPAPFFKNKELARTVEATRDIIPLPPSRPVEAAPKPAMTKPVSPAPDRIERTLPSPAESRAAVPARDMSKEARQTPMQKPDLIGALLRDPTAPVPPGVIPNPAIDSSKRILAIQEALKKLGHQIKTDGVAGPDTRIAIESFERAQKLQVSGQMSPRVVREIELRAGVKIP